MGYRGWDSLQRTSVVEQSVVVTGANSYLGRSLVHYLIARTPWRVYAIVSPRSSCAVLGIRDSRLTVLQTDLTSVPLPDSVSGIISDAHSVVHFAWSRSRRLDAALLANQRMIDSLFNCMSKSATLLFMSSVAASPAALSVYGRAKYEVAKYIVSQAGVAFACGLVIDHPPHGPYALLSRFVQSLPLRLRFSDKGPPVYPISLDIVCGRLAACLGQKIEGGTYQFWEPPIPMNLFLEQLENDFPRWRIRARISASSLRSAAAFVAPRHLPFAGSADKILSFLHKDEAYLASLPDLAITAFSDARGDSFGQGFTSVDHSTRS